MRPFLVALIGMAMMVAAVFLLAGREWGAALLLVFGLLTLLVGVANAMPGGSDGRP